MFATVCFAATHRRWPNTRELCAATADPGTTRSDADEEATQPRDRTAPCKQDGTLDFGALHSGTWTQEMVCIRPGAPMRQRIFRALIHLQTSACGCIR